MTGSATRRATAQQALEEAAAELVRLEVMETLRATRGLVYRALDGAEPPYLVAWDGRFVGEVHQRGPSCFRCWYVLPYDEDETPTAGEPDYGRRPFGTARAAAASLVPDRRQAPS